MTRDPGPHTRTGRTGGGPGSRIRDLLQWISRVSSPHLTLLLILAVGLVPALALTLVSAEVYESVAESDGIAGLDRPVLEYALTLRSPGLDAAVTGFTNLAGSIGMPIIAGLIVLGMCLRWRSWTPLVLTAAAAAGSLLMTISGKAIIGRTRPDLADAVPPYESSASFPSGHTLNSIVIAGILAYLVILHVHTRRAKAAAVLAAAVFTLAVGLSRVYLGHHWLTDVLVAWTLGAAWLAVVITAHQLLRRLHGRREAVPGSPPRRRR
ncbi:phosphatase PAP2 family protein [Arthrobacter sp. zg-Y20]|uniref:phosphatase PAP2 family protein n=1 Tax=unclassified Arthrobacter TaxID=235627 RepID=UPI001D15B299|nr:MULTISPECIES: phosphatase PAP2 family protein [unclassified Arthrobacter]MCC3275823.1 phosphatase PAP2 family protein [Arthrobacter sp. zg-Y20]MDK1315980.1 phosphatase PAP2 family protein [Arthrobacter sp. zg.Y20]WIB06243.1 phosphatase PAP2 family protein [Arthrobacter sp. zg-Y20]